jgi:hypothetical protein
MPPPAAAPAYVQRGSERFAAKAMGLPFTYPVNPATSEPLLTRWDGLQGSAHELLADTLSTVRRAVDEPGFVHMNERHGVRYEYSPARSATSGNRFFRLSGQVEIPPSLYVAGLMSCPDMGACDATLRFIRVLHDFDAKCRAFHLCLQTGPRPLCADRDDLSLSLFTTDPDGTWWVRRPPPRPAHARARTQQVSTTTPSHIAAASPGTIRLETRVWGYRLVPVQVGGKTHTNFTLVSETEPHGWLPKPLVNRMVPSVLSDYVRTLEAHLKKKLAGPEAKALVEAFGLGL